METSELPWTFIMILFLIDKTTGNHRLNKSYLFYSNCYRDTTILTGEAVSVPEVAKN